MLFAPAARTPVHNEGMRLAHGWTLTAAPEVPRGVVKEFVRPAAHAVPPALAARLGCCRISLVGLLVDGEVTSEWTRTDQGLDVSLATTGEEPHDVAIELLTCLGQALWETMGDIETEAFLRLLREEIAQGVTGEIDEAALEEKRTLLSPESAESTGQLLRYAQASFAGTAAEYVHALWHDVTVRTGPEFLDAETLRRRLQLLARWFPPGEGQQLFSS